ncbi:EF-hand domain-containing protein [Flexibacterium corallicola]|uniref:EF-hand domain-containing protein n=1 Tax=Flexibacterium corallicola TaxID=3037259 RepID=UPI00286FA0B1|nr:EF-hand domain-containing protein [Pseudovibrio sp. M1P-2-3]
MKVFGSTILAATTLALAGTSVASAMPGNGGFMQGKPAPYERLFDRFDRNGDGSFDQSDVNQVVKEEFTQINRSGGDGFTLEDWQTYKATKNDPKAVRMFQRFDTDGNGQITREEFVEVATDAANRMNERKERAKGPRNERGKGHEKHMRGHGGGHKHGLKAFFAQVDTNNDGKISADEIAVVADQVFANGPLTLETFKPVAAQFSKPMSVRSFQRMDANGDLQVTFEEYSKGYDNFVERMDRNNDGVVTKADLKKHKKGKGGHGPHGERKGK